MAFHLGIGSWMDDSYVGVLYPPELPKKDRLHDYTRSFNHVEVNSSFYATPKADVVREWVKQTPEGFTFSIKLHKAFSQSPAKAAEEGVLIERLLAGVAPLVEAKRLSAFLLVLPARFSPKRHSLSELDPLVAKLAPHALAVELRDADWVWQNQREETLGYFRERKVVWVAVDMPRIAGSSLMPSVDEVTHPNQAYLRLHGRNPNYLEAETTAEGHTYAYPETEIAELATRVRQMGEKASDVFVIANNHAADYAPKTALALAAALR